MVLANYGKGLQPLCEALRKGERTRLSMPLFFTSDHVHTPRRERPCVILTGRIRRAERCTTIGVDPVVTKPQTEHTGKQVSAYPPPRKAVFSKERKNIHRIHFKSEPMGRKIYLSPGWTAGFTSCQQLIVSSNSFLVVSLRNTTSLLPWRSSLSLDFLAGYTIGVNILWFISIRLGEHPSLYPFPVLRSSSHWKERSWIFLN